MASQRRLPISRRGFLATSLGAALAACGDASLPATARDGDAEDGLDPIDGDDGPDLAEDLAADLADDTAVAPDGEDVSPDTNIDASTDAADTVQVPHFDPDAFVEAGSGTYPVGVWSADPTSADAGAQAVILATRFLGEGPLELVVFRIEVDPEGDSPTGPLVLRQPVDVGDGGFVTFDLRSARVAFRTGAPHAFVFVAGDRRSLVGRFRTPPAADASPVVRLGVTSCASYTFRPFQVLERAAESDLDAFVLLGDTTYADDARTLDEYRSNWQRNLQVTGYVKLRPQMPTIATWDDHEVDNNWNPETFDGARLSNATRCFFEYATPRTERPRIWRSLRFGTTVEVFVLDGRGERRPSTRTSAEPLYLSNEQRDWLVDGLLASPCTFKIVANTVSIAKWPPLYLGGDDRWQGYAKQREHILSRTKDVPGMLWVAGDFHFGSVNRIDPPGEPFHDLSEVLVGPVAHLNPALSIVELTGDKRQFLWLSGERNYGRFICDPGAGTLTVEHVGPGGTVLNRHVLTV